MHQNYMEHVVSHEAFFWGDDVSQSYHAVAAGEMDTQWNSFVAPAIEVLAPNLDVTVDFACGFGRNGKKLLSRGAKKIIFVDVNQENIKKCQGVFIGDQFQFIVNNGFDLRDITTSSVSFFYSFDAMVHFDCEIVISYIHEMYRILGPGGSALVHHSNYSAKPGGEFQSNPHWRNFMSHDLFCHLARRVGFDVVRQYIVPWGGVADIDCISILRV